MKSHESFILRQLVTFNNPETVKLLESPGKAGGLPKGNYR